MKDELFQNYDTTSITASAFVQQREKIKFTAFETLLKNFNKSFYGEKLYRGYRLIGVDGSSLSIHPDPTDADNYRQDRPEIKGFSHMHLNAFYDLLNKRYVDAFIQPGNKSNERYAKKEMVLRYDSQDKTIFIGDRGYENYNNFMHISKKRKNYLVRVKDRNSNGILSGLILPDEEEFDIDIDIILTRRNTNNVIQNPHIYKFMPQHQIFDFMDENKECNIQFRIVRIKLSEDNYEAIITNLDRNEFPAEDISIYITFDGALKHPLGI